MAGSQSRPGVRGRWDGRAGGGSTGTLPPHLCVPAPHLLEPLLSQLLPLPYLLLQELLNSVAGLDLDQKIRVHFLLGRKGRAVRWATFTETRAPGCAWEGHLSAGLLTAGFQSPGS